MANPNMSSVVARIGDLRRRRRTLLAACGLHAVHDGMTDAIYVLLPIWQSQFAMSYAVVGLLRGVYAGPFKSTLNVKVTITREA